MNKGCRLARCCRIGVLWHSEPRARAPVQGEKKSEIGKFDWEILSHLLGNFAGVVYCFKRRKGKIKSEQFSPKFGNMSGES